MKDNTTIDKKAYQLAKKLCAKQKHCWSNGGSYRKISESSYAQSETNDFLNSIN